MGLPGGAIYVFDLLDAPPSLHQPPRHRADDDLQPSGRGRGQHGGSHVVFSLHLTGEAIAGDAAQAEGAGAVGKVDRQRDLERPQPEGRPRLVNALGRCAELNSAARIGRQPRRLVGIGPHLSVYSEKLLGAGVVRG